MRLTAPIDPVAVAGKPAVNVGVGVRMARWYARGGH
jgi:hypothetical protein